MLNDVPTAAMRTVVIGEVRPQEQQEQDQPSSSTVVHPPTQDDEQVPQEVGHDQGGAQEDQVMEEEAPRVPPTQVRATIQRHHPGEGFFLRRPSIPTADVHQRMRLISSIR